MALPRAPMLFLLLALAACAPEPTWFQTCGDPSCSGYAGPFDGVPLCTSEAVGATCPAEGDLCDPQDSCNALLECTTEDPTAQEGGCPISRVRYKRDVHYLAPAEREAAARAALDTKLATWSYRWDPQGQRPHLGFLIDDQETSASVTADGEHVDLYGYTSLTLAAVQVQAETLSAQEARIRAQDAELAELRATVERLSARLDALDTRPISAR